MTYKRKGIMKTISESIQENLGFPGAVDKIDESMFGNDLEKAIKEYPSGLDEALNNVQKDTIKRVLPIVIAKIDEIIKKEMPAGTLELRQQFKMQLADEIKGKF
jgi:hypothetical protein